MTDPGPRSHARTDSPVGPISLTAADGRLVALSMTDAGPEPDPSPAGPDARVLHAAVEQLAEYFAGGRTEFDLPLHQIGTDFQRRVWAALLRIPYGATATYGEIAAEIGAPTAARAVGLANGRNPIGIVVPCHRVIGAGGVLVGYAGGLHRKRSLLALEQAGTRRGQLPLPA